MNYYNEIKEELTNNEIYKKVKDYSKNRNDLNTYYNVGKLLNEAGKEYGKNIIREYSKKLMKELNISYNERTLRRFRQFYLLFINIKWSPMATKLSWSHYVELMPLKNFYKIEYYINISIQNSLSKRELRQRIKSNEYERLDEKAKEKLIKQEEIKMQDYIKNPIMIRNKKGINTSKLSEKLLKQLILEDIEYFMSELGNGFCYIDNEYKIKIGTTYNYIDILLYNIKYNCYVIIELKTTELKKDHIGQIETYINYFDKNIKNIKQDKTIGIIISKKENKFIMEYCSDKRILSKEFFLAEKSNSFSVNS